MRGIKSRVETIAWTGPSIGCARFDSGFDRRVPIAQNTVAVRDAQSSPASARHQLVTSDKTPGRRCALSHEGSTYPDALRANFRRRQPHRPRQLRSATSPREAVSNINRTFRAETAECDGEARWRQSCAI